MSASKRCDGGASWDYLPERLPRARRLIRLETAAFTGLSAVGTGRGGTVADGVNLSARRYPALATRKPRRAFGYCPGGGTPHGMIRFGDALYAVYGTGLYRMVGGGGATLVATVSDTDKQLFVFGDRLYMYPDKLYVERDGATPRPIEIDTGVLEQVEFSGNTISLSQGMTWEELGFGPGDCLRVINADEATPVPNGDYRINSIWGRTATMNTAFASYTSKVRLQRVVPTLERYCVSGNRVYGFAGQD